MTANIQINQKDKELKNEKQTQNVQKKVDATCNSQQYLLFTLHLLEVFQSPLCLGFLIECTHCLRESIRAES